MIKSQTKMIAMRSKDLTVRKTRIRRIAAPLITI
jgi:hypothetical protein